MKLTLSHSTYSSLMTCPKKIIWKRANTKGPLSANLLYGTTYHYALRHLYENGTDPYESAATVINLALAGQSPPGERPQDNWDGRISIRDKDTPPDAMIKWIGEAVTTYVTRFPKKPDVMELRVERQYKDFTLVGYIDAIRDGGAIDFKLASTSYTPDTLQAAFYALLLGGPTRFEFHVMRKKTKPDLSIVPIPEASSPAYLSYVERMILPQAAKLLTLDDLPANPSSFLCAEAYCQYWHLCVGSTKPDLTPKPAPQQEPSQLDQEGKSNV